MIEILFLVGMGTLAAMGAASRHRQRQQFRQYFAKPNGFTTTARLFRDDNVTWVADDFRVELRWSRHGRDGRCMEVRARPDPLDGRTSIHVVPRRPLHLALETLGSHAVESGDPTLDAAVRASADKPDVLRALLRLEAVRRAIIAVFAFRPDLAAIRVDAAGLHCRRACSYRMSPEEAHRFMQQVLALARALRGNAAIPPAHDRQLVAGQAQGGAAGAPIAIPVDRSRR
ncbi:MAG: hypothetical protein HY904_16865 [Deltaproteobacteria bacterium]|nr:hypothetical protein [Deltaproteobacteria bacterium]